MSEKPSLVLLHGALGARDQFDALVPFLEDRYALHLINFEGHGDQPLIHPCFRVEYFAKSLNSYLEENNIERTNLFGYSLGGYTAMYLAATHPYRIRRVFTLGTRFSWSPELAARECKLLNPDLMIQKIPEYAGLLQERHTALGWRVMLEETAELLIDLGEKDLLWHNLEKVTLPVRIGVGDSDRMAGLEESVAAYRLVTNGQLEIFPSTPHPLERISVTTLARSIIEFFS